MTSYRIETISEDFGPESRRYNPLHVRTEMEQGKDESAVSKWGNALSLSFVDTVDYCEKNNVFVPSSALTAQIYLHCINNTDNNAQRILHGMNHYWNRTMSIVSFPTSQTVGYVVHYPHVSDNDFVRDENGKIVGDVSLDLDENELPTYGENLHFDGDGSFLAKLIGDTTATQISNVLQQEYAFTPNVWIPPKHSIETSPERLVLFGGFKEYGQGIWLTSNSPDKTIVGTRPFRCARSS